MENLQIQIYRRKNIDDRVSVVTDGIAAIYSNVIQIISEYCL